MGAETRGVRTARIALLLATVVGLVLLGRAAGEYIPAFAQWVEGLGWWGPLAYVAGYVVAVVAFAPASILTLVAGAIFGVPKGTVYVFAAATIGSSLAFLVSRYVARAWVERRVTGNPRFAAIDRAVGREGRKIVFLLRLSPVFPFNLLNYALGLTRVRFADYVIAAVGMLPGTLMYVYLGKVAGDVAALAGGAPVEGGALRTALFGVGLIATVVVTTLVTRIARRALAEATGAQES
jgi:uncharacterized membrane protein YdjX (TVP38/TMEM64 family)